MTHYSSDIIKKYAAPVPRYTSYPTAPHFNENVGAQQYEKWLEAMEAGTPVSLYIHIPFCDRLCWFCGCHTKHTRKYEPVREYLEVLYKEFDLLGSIIGDKAQIKQLHLGGGSPSMLLPEDLAILKSNLTKNFNFSDDAEISIELDPSDIDDNILSGLAQFGMTRASIGVQDFAEDVQKAINRPQTFEDTKFVANALRGLGINSLNIDALYGLPLQTQSGLRDTLTQILSLKPDRIALFGYAHVPWMKKHQQMILEKTIPGLDERFAQARMAEKYLGENGYEQIGIDHFSLRNDSLEKANRSRTMKRNFQGYTTDESEYLIGMGASSIGQTPFGYIQNTHATANYMRQVNEGQLPIAKGLVKSEKDKMHAAVIEQLMCYFKIRKTWLNENFDKDAAQIVTLAKELVASNEDGYFVEREDSFVITQEGQPFARQFAAHFDEYLGLNAARHSVAV